MSGQPVRLLFASVLSILTVFPLAAQQPGPGIAPQLEVAPVPPPAENVTHVEVKRSIRAGFEAFLGSYLTVDRNCQVGDPPKVEFTGKPANGEMRTRPAALNIRDAPGAPRRGCVGISPRAIGVYYRPKYRFKGEDAMTFRVLFADGRIREVSATVEVR